MTIKELVMKSKEARVILTDFALRKRVHKDKTIDVNRMYFRLTDEHGGLSKTSFDSVFKDLETMGMGVFDKNKHFLPLKNIRDIGRDAINNPVLRVSQGTPKPPESVVVLFRIKGMPCRAEVPKDALDIFERLVNV